VTADGCSLACGTQDECDAAVAGTWCWAAGRGYEDEVTTLLRCALSCGGEREGRSESAAIAGFVASPPTQQKESGAGILPLVLCFAFQLCDPLTAVSDDFSLLCCQPEAVHHSLTPSITPTFQ
jgi:hypothetical protein